jgi:hypothetical protein
MKPNEHQILVLWAAECADHVLAIFESHRPKDARPRKAIEAARGWVRGEVPVGKVRQAALGAHAAARSARNLEARAAASAAGQAAEATHVPAQAGHAAAYAAAAEGAAPPKRVTRKRARTTS